MMCPVFVDGWQFYSSENSFSFSKSCTSLPAVQGLIYEGADPSFVSIGLFELAQIFELVELKLMWRFYSVTKNLFSIMIIISGKLSPQKYSLSFVHIVYKV